MASGKHRMTHEITQPTGPAMRSYAKLGEQEIRSMTNDRLELEAGHLLAPTPAPVRIHLFDTETGRPLRG